MATSERTPAIISFSRISIGWLNATVMPGNFAKSSRIFSTSSTCVRAFFHFSRGLRARKKSVSSMPIGSVAISALPSLDQMFVISSGNSAKRSFSIRVL